MANPHIGPRWRTRLALALFTLLLTLGVGFVLSSELLLTQSVAIEQGQAASEDIAAPRRIEFDSEILTDRARIAVLADVKDVYDPLDRQVGREQVYKAQQVLDFVDSVRADPYATPADRRQYLDSIETVDLSPPVVSDTLQLADAEWKTVQAETRRVLAQVMREEIKTGQEDQYRRGIRALIDFELNEPQTAIVSEVASGLVRANRAYNAEATEAARQAAIDSVPPQMRVLEENEVFIRSGELVTAEDIEALQALGLLNPQVNWQAVGGTMLFVFLLAVSTSLYLWTNEPELLHRAHHLLLLLLLVVLFAFLAKWGASEPISQPLLVPLATLGMLVTVLFSARLGLVIHLLLCLVVAYMTGGQLNLFVYYLAGGLVGVFVLRRANRINAFIWAGVYVMVTNVIVILTFALLEGDLSTLELGRSILAGLVNGAFCAILTLGGYYLLGMAFNITTTLQLLDLARPTHPLMRALLLKAPGTYHHSIMVGNLAEQAAEAVDADALLARVGAYYHDIGKTMRPYFFTENQMDNSNPHDLLDPETSAGIIRSHTRDGLELARKYRLPQVIRAFITEHHGTSRIGYFYHKASKEYGEENIDAAKYQHLGPRPQSKETAIVMLADACEAAVRSVRPHDAQELEELVRRIVSGRISGHQLDDAPLTLREIETITTSFIDTLQGVFHPRIRYPAESQALGPGPEPVSTAQDTIALESGSGTAMGSPDADTAPLGSPSAAGSARLGEAAVGKELAQLSEPVSPESRTQQTAPLAVGSADDQEGNDDRGVDSSRA